MKAQEMTRHQPPVTVDLMSLAPLAGEVQPRQRLVPRQEHRSLSSQFLRDKDRASSLRGPVELVEFFQRECNRQLSERLSLINMEEFCIHF